MLAGTLFGHVITCCRLRCAVSVGGFDGEFVGAFVVGAFVGESVVGAFVGESVVGAFVGESVVGALVGESVVGLLVAGWKSILTSLRPHQLL
jgi:hypothetical protein